VQEEEGEEEEGEGEGEEGIFNHYKNDLKRHAHTRGRRNTHVTPVTRCERGQNEAVLIQAAPKRLAYVCLLRAANLWAPRKVWMRRRMSRCVMDI
jgi:hypothetical protein